MASGRSATGPGIIVQRQRLASWHAAASIGVAVCVLAALPSCSDSTSSQPDGEEETFVERGDECVKTSRTLEEWRALARKESASIRVIDRGAKYQVWRLYNETAGQSVSMRLIELNNSGLWEYVNGPCKTSPDHRLHLTTDH
jgi:hypothetical protein